jgi:polar amino acid transport system substrate-binding protein
MCRYLYTAFTFLLASLSFSLQAENSPKIVDQRQVFEIGISMSIPPWVIKEDDSGIELDILRAALGNDKYDIRPVYLPFERAYRLFDNGDLDAVMNAKENVAKHGFLSDPVVTFQNYAISLSKKGFSEDISMSFLQDKSVVGFQKAKQFLGQEYAEMALTNQRYEEVPKQDLQINLLFIREIDFIVMDKSIFGYFWYRASHENPNLHVAKEKFKQKVTFHPLFKPSAYPFLFKDEQVRNDFNRGLKMIKSDGRYQEIHDRYSHLSDLYKH